jgi:Zn-dependent peptidase ImmA (M78 family)
MKLKKNTFVKAYAYFKDQSALAQKKEDNDEIVEYYRETIYNLFDRYYSQ